MTQNPGSRNGRRVAVVGGLRTPFMRSGTAYRRLSTLDLAAACLTELLERSGIEPGQVDQVVFGAVVADVSGPNIARDLVLRCGLPASVDAYSVSRACATSTQAIVGGTQSILDGTADVVIAGGADSLSRPPIVLSDAMVDALTAASRARSPADKIRAFRRVRPRHLAPQSPALEDKASGLTMGQAAEKMARENGISREAQDRFAYDSHRKAVAAWQGGIFADEVMALPIPPDFAETVSSDGIPRSDTSLDKLAGLPAVFDRAGGTVTAGNSSPLTDGAAAVILMEESTARRLGLTPRAFVRSWAFAAIDPSWQMLMGPSFATPVALDRTGLTMADIDIVDMHEAFAGQVLSNLEAFASSDWASRHLDRRQPIGAIDPERLNLYGGSISLGHPFAATGARQTLTMANELSRRGHGTALVTQCAAGGLGATLILDL